LTFIKGSKRFCSTINSRKGRPPLDRTDTTLE